jgi:hypothetical protein
MIVVASHHQKMIFLFLYEKRKKEIIPTEISNGNRA